MKLTDLKNAVEGIDFDKDRQEQMILEIQAKKRTRGYAKPLRVAVAFAVCVLTATLLSVPVRAVVSSLVRERMESLPKEEVTQIAEQVQEQRAEADSATREYTEGEKERRGELYAQYMEGRFPAGGLTQVDSEKEAEKYEFCFLTTTGVFYLPVGRELTDEEILERIDFEKKRDYALQEQHAEELAAREAAEREQVKEVVASGGITEEQAVETATGYLKQVYGLDGSGMELNHYFNAPDSSPAEYSGTYCVNWSDTGNCRYYYFWINAADGTLQLLTYSYDIEGSEEAKPSVSEAPGKIADIKKRAQNFLEEKLEIRDNFTEVKSYYRVNVTDGNVGRLVDVLFVKEDGASYLVASRWDGEVCDFYVTTKEDYEDHLQEGVQAHVDYYREREGREVKMEIVEN